ncbi:phosphoribosylanthranilate isomerase [Sphingomonas canadensis]|uniref:N-(5'-phosphoribosyl)anthranilate isomerase n=1 Tax=Sphingomonas canadensis TaxID=1219257 RepID=A0ABW3HAR0_9SPHN|nr:phosphoribosylanthranilate isomerase [Sphingomonas canadensis]MCW3837951.1 phosphoribosylanthranilate isomerase [Sphingomonas canadensis]
MSVTAKICGLSTPETLDAAVRGGASHVGFVFFAPSPRNLGFDRAAGLAARVPGHVGRVGVFVDPDNALVEAAVAAGRLDVLQLHKTCAARRADLRARFGLPVWAAIPVQKRADLAAAGHIEAADRILYDAKTPEGAALPGGMGLRFDWRLLEGFAHPLPWALSGGLDAGNVAEAVRITGVRLVDVSSGVETAPGVKDVDKIAAFCKAVSQC